MRPSIQLSCGRYFHYTSFGVRDIRIENIAASLAKLPRFTGHALYDYKVGQHSIIVSKIVEATHPDLALAGLLHDATEAYINDLARPFKLLVPEYVEYEKSRLWPTVAARFDLPDVLPQVIKDADNIALVTERRDLMPIAPPGVHDEWEWAAEIPRLPRRIKAVEDWRKVESMFMRRYRQLTKGKSI